MVKSCPFCTQKSSRKFNMEVHIKRRHRGMDFAVNNPYGAINARNFGYPNYNYNLKSSYSPNNRIFNNGESIWGQTNRDDREGDYMDHIINLLSKQVKIKDLINQLMPPDFPEPFSRQFYYPSTLSQFIQRSPNFSTLPFHQSSLAIPPADSINISGPVSGKGDENLSEAEASIKLKSFQLISLRGLICDKCLTVATIPGYLYRDGTIKEIHNHSCSEDRVLDLKRRDNHDLNRFFVLLHRTLPKILATKVLMCNKSQSKIYLWIMKCDGFSSSNTDVYDIGSLTCPIRFLDTFPSEHRWINQIRNSQKREDIVELEPKEELLPFLEISIDSTLMMLKVKRDSSLSPSENWDSYLVGLNLPEYNLEKVNKPFIPKFPN